MIMAANSVNAQTIALDPQVRKGVLPNGFTYYLRHNDNPTGRVVFNLVVKVGSIVEDDDQSGMAHFMEHMSFNGTKHFPKNQLVDYLQQNGLRFGADINASTGFDETVYQLPLTNSPAVLKKGLLIIRDWAQEATLDNDEINKERGVILEEKRTQMGAGQRMQEQYTPMLFNNSRYADRNPIGTDSSLKHFDPSALRRFYKDWYRPDLQGIIAVGDFDVTEMENLVRASFSSLKNPSAKRPRQNYRIDLNNRDGFIALKDAEMNSTIAQIIIKHEAPEMKTEQDYCLAVTRRLLNIVMAKRLRTLVANDSAKVLHASASIGELMGGLDNFSVNLITKPELEVKPDLELKPEIVPKPDRQAKPDRPGNSEQLAEGVTAVWTEIERMRNFGFNVEELELAKERYANGMKNGLLEKDKISSDSFVKEYVAHFLRGDLAPGMDTEYKLVMKFLSEITVKDLNNRAGEYIRKDNRNIIVMVPLNANLPSEGEFKSWLTRTETSIVGAATVSSAKTAIGLLATGLLVTSSSSSGAPTVSSSSGAAIIKSSAKIAPGVAGSSFKAGTQLAKSLLRLEPVAGKVLSSVGSAEGISTLKLSNGITVVLKPTTFRNDEILFSGFSAGGTSVYEDADYYSAKNAASIVSSSGAGNFSHKDLEEYLSGKQMGVQPFISEFSQGVTGGSTAENIGKALELAHAFLTEPVMDKALFEQMISRSKVSVAGRDKNPEVVFQDSIAAILAGYHPRSTPVTVQKIDQIKLERVYKIYKERFADNSGMTFTFVGTFNIDSLKPLLEKYLASLPSAHKNFALKATGKTLRSASDSTNSKDLDVAVYVGGKNASFKDPGIPLPAANINTVIKTGLGAKARVELFYTGVFNYDQKERLKLEALKGVLELTLTERLREKESGVYSPSVSLGMDKIPRKEFRLGISFECAPENTERLIRAALDEVTKLRDNGPSAVNLDKYRMESIRSREIAIKPNQWWLGYISAQLQDGEPLSADSSYLKNLGQLERSQLKAAAAEYLKIINLSQFVLLPEASN